ncbi:Threonine synthase [hydrothermal vent metagenome]|uniref:Threonine synthase n=1 Tax=hydrothermal vent metagenome TaxID=652676 RepID=A0A3B0UNX1_9ZZZZ
MQYVSTRGTAPKLRFCDAVMAGLASDGGLYLPESWPEMTAKEISALANRPYRDVAFEIISRFVDGEISDPDLNAMISDAYRPFRHSSVAPVVELEPGHFLLELFHGPTLAFKDIAMQLLARIIDHILAKRGGRATIVGATSGDTGSAAIEAFRGRANTDIFILHPHNRVSEVQRRQMTTVADQNVYNIAIKGSFDDCQNITKAMFNNSAFRNEVQLSGVNSINWGRIVAQIVYYFTAATALGAPQRKISFCVPTGNFGDIFAGYAAKRMGLPIERLIIATNSNDILNRALKTGTYEMGKVTKTTSPSMDIQISSNFERLLFEASGRDPDMVLSMMNSLQQSGGFELDAVTRRNILREFSAGAASEQETSAAIASVYKANQYLLDPHSAVGVHVARRQKTIFNPMVTLATAHPAKFPEAVKAASNIEPQLPDWLADLYELPERMDILGNDQQAVEEFIRARIRA